MIAVGVASGGQIDAHRGNVEFENQLSKFPRKVAADAVIRFLDSEEDVQTKIGFTFGENGILVGTPSMRLFLLDWLGQNNLAAAGLYAEKIFRTKNSADEWALAFRNYAWSHGPDESREYLRERFQEMLEFDPWMAEPSPGFLESFDVAVYTESYALIPALEELLVRDDDFNQQVAHAAYIALDRLVLGNPVESLDFMLKEWDLLEGREGSRAGFFARADVRDINQREIIEDYLLKNNISQEELDLFAGLFPNQNYFLSNNLLTQSDMPSGSDIIERDRASLEIINQWFLDERYEELKPQLKRIRERLEYFLRAGSR